jgi:hypothetical protein
VSNFGVSTRYPGLPILAGLRVPERLTRLTLILMVLASAFGWLFPERLYTSPESFHSFAANDIVNLLLGTPVLLAAIGLARRGRLVGLLLWPGALLYVLYNYTAYLLGVPAGPATVAYGALIALSACALLVLLRRIDAAALRERLDGAIFEQLVGGILLGMGFLFGMRALGVIAAAFTAGNRIPASEMGVLVSDLVLSVLWVWVGSRLWRRKPLGYSLGPGLLFQAGMLFAGLIGFLMLQPALGNGPLPSTDLAVVGLMGLVCFIPLALLVRSVMRLDRRG